MFVWYCIDHGDCVITDKKENPPNSCIEKQDFKILSEPNVAIGSEMLCNCEMIYEITNSGEWIRKGDNYSLPIKKYFEIMNDGYQLEYLERLIKNKSN